MDSSRLVGSWLRRHHTEIHPLGTMGIRFVNMTTTGRITAGSLIINGLLTGTAVRYNVAAYYSNTACYTVIYCSAAANGNMALLFIILPPVMALLPIPTLEFITFSSTMACLGFADYCLPSRFMQ